MPSDQPPHPTDDPLEMLRHELKTSLTEISGQAQLMRRRIGRLDGLNDRDRAWLLERSAHIDAAIMDLLARIERIGAERPPAPAEVDASEPTDHGDQRFKQHQSGRG